MEFYRINGINGSWGLVNLEPVFFVNFNDEGKEIIFDGILKIIVEDGKYELVRKEVLRKMFNLS